jgi:hypothetical protein
MLSAPSSATYWWATLTLTFPLRSHASNVPAFANLYKPSYVTWRFGAGMIWHESSPKQPHPRLWLSQVQRPLSDRRANLSAPPLLALIHRSTWKVNSTKVVFSILHNLSYQIEVRRLCPPFGIEVDTTGSADESVCAMVYVASRVAGRSSSILLSDTQEGLPSTLSSRRSSREALSCRSESARNSPTCSLVCSWC